MKQKSFFFAMAFAPKKGNRASMHAEGAQIER